MAINFPDSPSDNDIYTVNGKRWIYSSGKWSIYGTTAPDATASDTEPSGVGDGHIWYRSDESQTLIRYDNTWVEVGSAGGFDNASTNFPTSLDSATGFAAVEALQAKVGADSSAVTSSHDYKIADHASRLTTLEGSDSAGLVHISRTTIGTAVSSVTVSSAFSADYDSYRIIVSGGAASASVSLQMLIGGLTTGYYYAGSKTEYGGASPAIARVANGSLWLAGVGHPNFLSADIHVHNPFTTTMPTYSATGAQGLGSSSGYTIFMAGFNGTTASQTDFVIQPNTGTMTGGTIDVYGYAKA